MSFTLAYSAAVWRALVAALLTSAAIQVLVVGGAALVARLTGDRRADLDTVTALTGPDGDGPGTDAPDGDRPADDRTAADRVDAAWLRRTAVAFLRALLVTLPAVSRPGGRCRTSSVRSSSCRPAPAAVPPPAGRTPVPARRSRRTRPG